MAVSGVFSKKYGEKAGCPAVSDLRLWAELSPGKRELQGGEYYERERE
jgi:hypothetical protein